MIFNMLYHSFLNMKTDFTILYLLLIWSILQIYKVDGQIECINTKLGENYVGTSTRPNCINWSTAPQNLNYKDNSQFPDVTVARAKNYCRNPRRGDGVLDPQGLFCYITSTASPNYEYCNLPTCTSLGVCRDTYLGETYNGKVDKTYTGKTCQRWDKQDPHTHSFNSGNWPSQLGETIAQAANYCRNPNNSTIGPWCYTTDSSIVWEPCVTSLCNTTFQCVNGTSPYNFRSLAQTDQFLRTCARWDSVPINYFDTSVKTPTFFANASTGPVKPPFSPALLIDPTLAQGVNFCRNPDNDPKGAWCYIQDGANFNKQYCKTPCTGIWACLYDSIGDYYEGTIDKTETGDVCDSWTNHPTVTAAQLPDTTVADAKNYCRNPDKNPGGPWCFIKAATKKFGFCSLPTCVQTPPIPPFVPTNVSSLCQNTTTGTEYSGTQSIAMGGATCLPWTTNNFDNPYFNRSVLFNAATMAEVKNYCRNPNRLVTGPWCYTGIGVVTKCNVELCVKPNQGPRVNCRTTIEALKYNGTVNVTADNQKCLRWDNISPMPYTNEDFVDGNVRYAENYCRGIAKNVDIIGPFCYVLNTASGKADQAPCVVKLCDTSTCRTTVEGYNYGGNKSITITGKTCLAWKTTKGLNYDLLPDESLDAASNYCRNPTKNNVMNGPFCYVTATATESCGINYCTNQCRKTQNGFQYNGFVNRIASLKCRKWNDASNTLYRDPTKLQATSLDAASNYCRNPNNDPKGPWCYTAANPLVVTYCRLAACTPNSNCQYPGSGWTYNGNISKTVSGKTCRPWTEYNAAKSTVTDFGLPWTPTYETSLLPDKPEVDVKNYCRAAGTTAPFNEKPWCVLADDDLMNAVGTGGLPYELCDVKTCNLTTTTMTTSTTAQATTTSEITTNPATTTNPVTTTTPDTTTTPATTTTQTPSTVSFSKPNTSSETLAPPITSVRTEHCITPENAFLYNGTMNVTSNGIACANWNTMDMATISNLKGPSYAKNRFPDNSVAEASNYCRTPTTDPNYMRQPWCFISPADAAKVNNGNNFGFCNISTCNTTVPSQWMSALVAVGMNVTLTFSLYTLGLSGFTLLELFEVISEDIKPQTVTGEQNQNSNDNDHEIVTALNQRLVQSQGPGQSIVGLSEIQPQMIQANQANPNFQAAEGFNIVAQGQDKIDAVQIQQNFAAGNAQANMVQFNQLNAVNGAENMQVMPENKIIGYGKDTHHMIQLKQLNAAQAAGKIEVVPQNKIIEQGKEINHMIQFRQLNAAQAAEKIEVVPKYKIVGYGMEEVRQGGGGASNMQTSGQAFQTGADNVLPEGLKIVGYGKQETFYGYYSAIMGSDYEDSKLPKITAAEYEAAQKEERRLQDMRDYEEARLLAKGTAQENIVFLQKAIAEEEKRETYPEYKSFKLEDFKRRLATYERQEMEKAQKELKRASGGDEIEEVAEHVETIETSGSRGGHYHHKHRHHGHSRKGHHSNQAVRGEGSAGRNDGRWRKVDGEVRYYDLVMPKTGGEYIVKAEVHGGNTANINNGAALSAGSQGNQYSINYRANRAKSAPRNSRVETRYARGNASGEKQGIQTAGSGGARSSHLSATQRAQGHGIRARQSGSGQSGPRVRASSMTRNSSYSSNHASSVNSATNNSATTNNTEEPFVSILDDWRPFG